MSADAGRQVDVIQSDRGEEFKWGIDNFLAVHHRGDRKDVRGCKTGPGKCREEFGAMGRL